MCGLQGRCSHPPSAASWRPSYHRRPAVKFISVATGNRQDWPSPKCPHILTQTLNLSASQQSLFFRVQGSKKKNLNKQEMAKYLRFIVQRMKERVRPLCLSDVHNSSLETNETKFRSSLDLFAGRGPEQERQRHQTSHVQAADPHGAGSLQHPRGTRPCRKPANLSD